MSFVCKDNLILLPQYLLKQGQPKGADNIIYSVHKNRQDFLDIGPTKYERNERKIKKDRKK